MTMRVKEKQIDVDERMVIAELQKKCGRSVL